MCSTADGRDRDMPCLCLYDMWRIIRLFYNYILGPTFSHSCLGHLLPRSSPADHQRESLVAMRFSRTAVGRTGARGAVKPL